MLLLAVLWYPISRIVMLHLTLTGACEEGLGYRYFYTLRLLYDDNGYIFLPQGHLMDLAHQTLQLVLTALGYSPKAVLPRIDIFSYCSIGLAHLLAALAFLGMSRRIPSLFARLSLVVLVLVPFYNVPISGFNVILEPDYMLWILPLMLVTAGSVFRVVSDGAKPWSQRDSRALAALVAAALGLKATLLIYPITLSVVLLIKRRGFQASFVQAVTATVLGVLGWLLIILVYYHFQWDYLVRYFTDEARFGSSVRPDVSYLGWFRQVVLHGHWLVRCSVLLPFAMLGVLMVVRSRTQLSVVLGALAGSLIYHLFLFFRDTPVTWFEAGNFLIFALAIVSYRPFLSSASAARKVALGAVVLAAATQVYDGLAYMHRYYIPYLITLNQAQTAAAKSLERYHDKIAFLYPDNSYRTLTIDSDIFKGGSNILDGPFFGRSALVRGMFPYRSYFAAEHKTVDLTSFRAVVFVVRKGMDPDPPGQLSLMEAVYGPALSRLTLRGNIDFGSQEFLVWDVDAPPRADARTP
jgi:hypothetical protein